ncbi:hypothetical protein VTN00DRAFT_6313 [Thermoascus crustaceus]|uniref:uncharacterized protein n=1 Tax=Thermoascus crustaceus TaxID=5088 RepID=UPI003743E005
MAGSGASSPLLTSHDTLGTSSIRTALSIHSSPPGQLDAIEESAEDTENLESGRVAASNAARRRSSGLSRSPNPGNERRQLDARLADYTLDLSKLRSEEFGLDEKDDYTLPELAAPREEDKLSDVGGPADFTVNMERYLFGDDSSLDRDGNDDDHEGDTQRLHESRQPLVEDEADVVEYSEFEPPVDMSTPSHLLRRNNVSMKDGTNLEDIEEDPADSSHTAITPSRRKQRASVHEEDAPDDLRRQVERLKDQLRDKDEQIRANRKRVLEAASAAEQIKHLQAELHRKTTLLNEMHAKRGDDTLLREQIQILQKQNDEKDALLQKASENESKLETLQQRVADLQAELKNRDESATRNEENHEMIASLQQQLDNVREELRKRDDALEESTMKLNEVTAAKDLEIRQKNTEIEELKAHIEDQDLHIEKLEEDIDIANNDYDTLEERIASLEERNRPLEEKNIVLEADLARAQSQVTNQQKGLETLAVDLSVETANKTFTEILDSIKALCMSRKESAPESPKESNPQEEEMDKLRKELSKLQEELKESTSARETLDLELRRSQDQVSELRSLITTIEGENSRLSSTFEELSFNLSKVQDDLERVKEEHAQALVTIERLGKAKESVQQQLSPPPSPPTASHSHQYDYNAVQEAHQAELKSLQSAHATAISTMRDSYAASTRNLRDLLAAAERRESELKSELQSARITTSTQKTQLRKLNAEIERLNSVIAVKDEASAAVDEKIARSVEKREKEWERRVDLLLKERDKMSKALLMAWGEKELPDVKDNGDEKSRGPRQGYRYKYVVRNGK